jgi:hypothetical protein
MNAKKENEMPKKGAKKIVEGKYDKYVLTDVIKETTKKEWGGQIISPGPGHENLLPADTWARAAITAVRRPYMFHEVVHKHMFTEYFLFFGSNPMDMKEFNAEVEFSFGADREKHTMSSPTIVIAPPGVYHCPLNFAKIDKPIYCMELFMTRAYSGVDLGEDLTEIRVPEPNYNRYFQTSIVRDNLWGGEGIGLSAVPEHLQPAGAKINAEITAIKKPYLYDDGTHKHSYAQYFYFFGSNPMDMHEFGAEVEISLGVEKEKHLITGPTVVIVPPGTYHGPLNYAKVKKPIYCLEVSMTSKGASTGLMP